MAMTDQQRQAIESRLFAGRKIEAIKLYREAVPRSGLAEAKQIVEAWEQQLRQQAPGKFAAWPKKSGCLGVLAGATFLAGAAVVATVLVFGE